MQLPQSIASLFWDHPAGAVALALHRDFVVERVLARGSWDDICWLRREVGDDALRHAIAVGRGRSLSRPQLRFWELVLELPQDDVEHWLSLPAREIWDRRSP